MATKNLSPSPQTPACSVARSFAFGDVAVVEAPFKVVHVTVPEALDSCVLNAITRKVGDSTEIPLDVDVEGRTYPRSAFTGPGAMTFIVKPGYEFYLDSDVAQTEEWEANAT